jgi:hypothetical protein
MDIFVGRWFHVPKTILVELLSNDVSVVLVSMDVTSVTQLDLVVKNADLILVLNQRSFAGATVNGRILGNRTTLSVIMINLSSPW